LLVKLAEKVVSGRLPALLIAAAIGFMPMLSWGSAVVVALVALRKGSTEAIWPFIGASIPAGVAWFMGDMSAVGILFCSLVGALVLANTTQLGLALSGIAFTAVLMTGVVSLFPEQTALLYEQYSLMLEQLQSEGFEKIDIETQQFVTYSIVWSSAWLGTLSLLLARWLQAKLYNPGGFQKEFHYLRLSPLLVGVLVAGMAASQAIPMLEGTLPVLVMPIMMAGFGLIHCIVWIKRMGNMPLVMLYASLVFMGPIAVLLLMVAAITDSFSNYRNKMIPPEQ